MAVLEFFPLFFLGFVLGGSIGLVMKRRPKAPPETARFDIHSTFATDRTVDLKSGDVIKFTGNGPVTLKCVHNSWFDVVVEGSVELPNSNRIVEI